MMEELTTVYDTESEIKMDTGLDEEAPLFPCSKTGEPGHCESCNDCGDLPFGEEE